MPKSKIAVSIEAEVVIRLDRAVEEGAFPNRSQAIELAIEEKLARLARGRLSRECAMLDPGFEQALADEGAAADLEEWPEY